jgi:chaperonin cofactor prefoldin
MIVQLRLRSKMTTSKCSKTFFWLNQRVRLGDGFIFTTVEEARVFLDADKQVYEVELLKRKEKGVAVQKEMTELKRGLMAKFGNKINLEEN